MSNDGGASRLSGESLGTVVDVGISGSCGRKDDSEKPRWSLLDLSRVEEIVKVLTFGARKYDDHNWRKVPHARDRYLSALLRHIGAFQRGERCDSESGLSHLAHAGCCLHFLQWFETNGGGE